MNFQHFASLFIYLPFPSLQILRRIPKTKGERGILCKERTSPNTSIQSLAGMPVGCVKHGHDLYPQQWSYLVFEISDGNKCLSGASRLFSFCCNSLKRVLLNNSAHSVTTVCTRLQRDHLVHCEIPATFKIEDNHLRVHKYYLHIAAS